MGLSRAIAALVLSAVLALTGAPAASAAPARGASTASTAWAASATSTAAVRARPRMVLTVTPRYPQIGATARLTGLVAGRYGRSAGWVRFRFDGHVIGGCRHVPLRHGIARCTAPRTLASVRHLALVFFGNARYTARWLFRTVYS